MFSTPTYVVCLDKLALNLRSEQVFDYQYITRFTRDGNVYPITSRVALRLIGTRTTKNYQYSWEVWIDNILAGTLSTDCIRPQKPKSQRFSFKNSVLYTLPGWAFYLDILTRETGLTYHSVGALEIALDLQPKDDLQDAKRWLESLDDIYKYLPREYNTDVRYRPVHGKLIIKEEEGTYYFGRSYTSPKSSGKQIVVYCKSGELSRGKKEYISEFYTANGLDVRRSIIRIEARCNNKFTRRIAGLAILELVNQEKLESLFLDAVKSSFQFRDLNQCTRDSKNRNLTYAVVNLLDLAFINNQPVVRHQHIKQVEVSSDDSNLRTVKRLTIELIRHMAEETLKEVRRFIQVNPAPYGECWYRKIHKYAQEYPGIPNRIQMSRIESISRIVRGDQSA